MDVRRLTFSEESFDIVIDKGEVVLPVQSLDSNFWVLLDTGTMDAMMAVRGDVWNPPQAVVEDCTAEIDEALRVLDRSGMFIYLTFGQPHFRK